MPLILVIIGGIILVAAIRNTEGDLGTALATDVPGFLIWAAALVAVGALGYVPAMRNVSRGLLALVLVVLVLTNYKQLFAGLSNVAPVQVGKPAVDPGTAYALNPNAPTTTQAGIQGTSQGGAQTSMNAPTTSPFGAFDPAAFLTAFQSGTGGFGGIA